MAICAATRIHLGDVSRAPDLAQLGGFVETVGPAVSRVAVAVGVPGVPEEHKASKLAELVAGATAVTANKGVAVDVIGVEPWGRFVPALNALLAHAARAECEWILYASVEAAPRPSVVAALRAAMDDASVLVAGAALPGHDFQPGARELSGVTVPWNTLALWRVASLGLAGFPMLADGIFPGVDGGVEEVSAIETLNRIIPDRSRALLLDLPGVEWETDFQDPRRAEWHARKMASKASRARTHLQLLASPAVATSLVYHETWRQEPTPAPKE